MKKRLVVLVTVIALLSLTVMPALAYNGIQFGITDSVGGDPWGTVAGQRYRIVVFGETSGLLLDTGEITSPPALDIICNFGQQCLPNVGTLGTPVDGEEIQIFIFFTGTNGDPQTFTDSFTQDATTDIYAAIGQTGTGPTAVTLQSVTAGASNAPLLIAGLSLTMIAGATFVLMRRRRHSLI